jgi:hypothetical protein
MATREQKQNVSELHSCVLAVDNCYMQDVGLPARFDIKKESARTYSTDIS